MRQKQLKEKYEEQLQNIATLERNLWFAIKKENGQNNLKCWNISCILSLELTKLGEKLIKENDFDQAEMYLMRAQQFTEPSIDKSIWIHQVEWFYQRLNIALNLQIMYTKQKRYNSCFDVLNQIIEQCEKSHLFEKIWQNIESNLDFAYYQLLISCIELKKYIQAFACCKKCISIIDYYEKEYNKQHKMVENNQQELLLQTYGEQRGVIYLEHKQLLFKKLTLRIYCFYQGGRALYKLGNKLNSLKFFKMAWKKSKEILKSDANQKVSLFFKKYTEVKNELEFDKNLNNESIGDFSKFTLEVKKASIQNHQKQQQDGNSQNQESQKSLDPEKILKQGSQIDLKNFGSANSLANDFDELSKNQQEGVNNLPHRLNNENFSDFLFSQNSTDNLEKNNKKQKKIEFADNVFTKNCDIYLEKNDQELELQQLMNKRQESKGSRKGTFLSSNPTQQTTNTTPKKTVSTSNTPKNTIRNATSFQTQANSIKQDTQGTQISNKALRKKRPIVSLHTSPSNQSQVKNNNQLGKFSNAISPKGIEPSPFSFTQQQNSINTNLVNKIKQQNIIYSDTDAPKNKRKLSSLEGITINSNSSLSFQSFGSDKEEDDEDTQENQNQTIDIKNKNQIGYSKKLSFKDKNNSSFDNLLVKFHNQQKTSLRKNSKIQRFRPLTAQNSRNNTLSDYEKRQASQGKLQQYLVNTQYQNQTNIGTNSQSITPTTAKSIQQDGMSTLSIRSQLNYFFKGRSTSTEKNAVKKIRKYYETAFGKSIDTQEDKTNNEQTLDNTQTKKDNQNVKIKNKKSVSTYQGVGGIETALDMNQFLMNQQQKIAQNSTKSGGQYFTQQSAKSFISNIFTNSQHIKPMDIQQLQTNQQLSQKIKNSSAKNSIHQNTLNLQNNNNNNRAENKQALNRKTKGSKSLHMSTNFLFFPIQNNNIILQQNDKQKTEAAIVQNQEKAQQQNIQINIQEVKNSEQVEEQPKTEKTDIKQVNFQIQETQEYENQNQNSKKINFLSVCPESLNYITKIEGSRASLNQFINSEENDQKLPSFLPSAITIDQEKDSKTTSIQNFGNYFLIAPEMSNVQQIKKKSKDISNQSQYLTVAPNDNSIDDFSKTRSKSKTIDIKRFKEKQNTTKQSNFLKLNQSSFQNVDVQDKKQKIYKQIDNILLNDHMIQSKVNQSLYKLSSPPTLPNRKYSNTNEMQLDVNYNQATNQSPKEQIKNDSNLIDFVQQSKLNMVVLARPTSAMTGILKKAKTKQYSPEDREEDDAKQTRGQIYQQMIDGVDSNKNTTFIQRAMKSKEKKETSNANNQMNSFQTFQNSFNQESKSSIRKRQQSEYVTSIYKQTSSKMKRQESQTSFTNLTQQQLQSYYTNKKQNLNQTQLLSQNGNQNNNALQRKQSFHKQNSITAINKKQGTNQGTNKNNLKNIVSLAAMPEIDNDQEEEIASSSKFKENFKNTENDIDSEVQMKNQISKLGNMNQDVIIEENQSKNEINKSKNLAQSDEQNKLEDKLKKVNQSYILLSENQSSFTQTSVDRKSHSLSPNNSAKKRRASDQIFQRKSLVKDSILQDISDLKIRVNKHRESINEMILQKRNAAARFIQLFWRDYKNGFKNQMDQVITMSTKNNIEGPTTSIMEYRNNNNNNISIQGQTNSSNTNSNNQITTQNIKFSKNNLNLQININQIDNSVNHGARQKKISDGSFKSQLSIKKQSFNFKSPSPTKYQRSQYFFPKVIETSQAVGSQTNIPSQYNQQNLMPHQHNYHRSTSVSSPKIISYFRDAFKNKQAIEARENLNDLQIKPILPLKFYLFQYQVGLQLWKIQDFNVNVVVQKDEVSVNMKFHLQVEQFQGILPLKFKVGIQDLQSLSQVKKATKWSLASEFLNYYFKSKNLLANWEIFQLNQNDSENKVFFALLDGMEEKREQVREQEEVEIQRYELTNKKKYQFCSNSQSYVYISDIHVQELIQVFEKLSFLIPKYTIFTKKENGKVINISENQIVQNGNISSNTSIQDKLQENSNVYENNLKSLRQFLVIRKAKIRDLELKSQRISIHQIDKKFHLISNHNLPEFTTNLILSYNKISNKKISSSCSIDDALDQQQKESFTPHKSMLSATTQPPKLNISLLKKNITKDGSQNFIKLMRNESGIDSPLTPANIFGKDQENLMAQELLDFQNQIHYSQSSIQLPSQYKNQNNSLSIDLQSDLMLEDNSSKNYQIKEPTGVQNIISTLGKKTKSSKNISINPLIQINNKYSSIMTNSPQFLSPQQQSLKSPSAHPQLQQQSQNNLMKGNNSRRSSLFFQKMLEQRMREAQQSLNQNNVMLSSSNTHMTSSKHSRQENSQISRRQGGEQFQEYIDDNLIIPNLLNGTPKNNQTPVSPFQLSKNDVPKSPYAQNNNHMFLSQQQYTPLSQSQKLQPKNQISFYEDENNINNNLNNYSLDLKKKGSGYTQDADSDQQLLLQKNYQSKQQFEYPLSPSYDEINDTPFFNSEQLKNEKITQIYKRSFKKATTIVEENQEEALQQSTYQGQNNPQNNLANKIITNKIDEANSELVPNQLDASNNIEDQEYKPLIKHLDEKKTRYRMKQIQYWRQFRYFEEISNNKYFYIPELYLNPFYQNQTILQAIVKKNKEFYRAVLKIFLVSEQQQEIDIEKKDGINVVLQLFQCNMKGKWSDELTLNLFQFIDEFFPSNDLNMLQKPVDEEQLGENQEFQLNYNFQKAFNFNKFIYRKGFDIKQAISLQKQLQGKIYIENCKINLIYTSKYKKKIKFDKNTTNYSSNGLENTYENSQYDINNRAQSVYEIYGSDDTTSKIFSQNTSNNIAYDYAKENISLFLLPQKRNQQLDFTAIKENLEQDDIRELLNIIQQKAYKPISDNQYYQIKLNLEVPREKSEGTQNAQNKQVNFNNLISKSRQSVSLLSRVLKASAKLKQNILKVERNVNQTSIDQNNEHISRVNERTLVSQGDVEILEFYNTAKKIDYKKIRLIYQIRNKQQGSMQSMIIQFKKYKPFQYLDEEELTSIVKIYNPINNQQIDQVIIKGKENIEKLINIIQYSQETKIPVYQLNFLNKNIGFFSRVYFGSYIEQNKETHINKFLQKYNEKDEALYDLLKNADTFFKEQSYLQLFLTRIKLTLISNFLSSHKHEQNFLLTSYFNSQKVSQYCNIKDLGKTIVQTVVYSTNPMFTSHRSVFICLHLFSKKMRNSYSKLVFTIEDIQHLISKEFTSEICLDKEKIINMVYLLCEKLVYFNTKQFPNFKLPLSNLNKNTKKSKYDLLNSFDPTPEPLALTKSILTNKTFLTPVLRSQKVIFIGIKKILNQYTIITVRRFDILDYYCIEIYIPKSGRKWFTNMYPSDLWRFNPGFMENLFPFIFWENPNIVEVIKSFKKERYLDFTRKYESDIVISPKKYIDKLNIQQQEHNQKFYSSTKYISSTKFRYEKYYNEYFSQHLASSNSMIDHQKMQIRSFAHIKDDGSSQNSIQNMDSSITINDQQRKSKLRKQTKRQISILKNSKSIGFKDSNEIINEDEISESIEVQSKQNVKRKLKRQLTFNEFLVEQNYVNKIDPTETKQIDNKEQPSQINTYYQSYLQSKHKRVSFDKFSYKNKPNQFLKIFEKNQLEATDVLELKIWEKIIEQMEVRVNEQGKLLFVVDSFKGLLKEILATFITHLRSQDNVQVQVTIEKQPQKIKSKLLLYLDSPKFQQKHQKSFKNVRINNKPQYSNDSQHISSSRQKKHKKKKQSSSSSDSSSNSSQSSYSSSDSSSQSSQDERSPIIQLDDENERQQGILAHGSQEQETEEYFQQVKNKYEKELLEKEMLGNSVSLYLEEAIKWDVFIRINFFEKLQTENEKLCMNLLLQQYFNENKNNLSQYVERFRSTNKKSAPRQLINKPSQPQRNVTDQQAKSKISSNRSSILEKLQNKSSSFKNIFQDMQSNNNKTTMMIQKAAKSVMINSPLQIPLKDNDAYFDQEEEEIKEEQEQSNYYPENYCFVSSDFVCMASMIKNKIRENYLPSALYEDEEYYQEQQKKQGNAYKHFENVLTANKQRRNTMAIVLSEKSPKNQKDNQNKRSFLTPNTYQSDKAPEQQEKEEKQQNLINKVKSRFSLVSNSNQQLQSQQATQQNQQPNQLLKGLGMNKSLRGVNFSKNDQSSAEKKANFNSPSTSRLSGFNSRLKTILLAQPSYFSNIEEAVKFEPKVQINCDINIQRLIDPNQKHFIIMYRGVFTKKPLQMIAIYYQTSKRKFFAEIWNIKTQKRVKQKIKFKQICYQIPFVKQLLKLKQYSEIGRRIFLTFKNALMISTYYQVNS
ncbi:hypothetical protein TTHERM_00780670 (macronuclear) [Tetrahymena thermophila SB210]|uniref:Uncharacterized protein n=1 Tax=Tetrahymena thermophila (strain SB210) TaxID=312017 RepID=I7MAS2_TETTS|nr:hypothetical protein TTHERM_00780670 [Tetrahymena thermophila SB210]EAS05978.2 hypothetical protein TTHERM_00780670 [Tetrahymena thermophila SB210]|eukprot:XP_001026223.2 hypothetical protein TTHERM_00780670 [Tetrahymena thermophila SB210]